MKEAEATAQINEDAAEAEALAAAVSSDFAALDASIGALDAAVAVAGDRLARLESNVRYAMEKFL